MAKKFVSSVDMYKSKSRDRKRRGASAGCLTLIMGVISVISAFVLVVAAL